MPRMKPPAELLLIGSIKLLKRRFIATAAVGDICTDGRCHYVADVVLFGLWDIVAYHRNGS